MKYSDKRKILHFFFPNRCPVCRSIIYANDTFCNECAKKLTYFTGCFTVENSISFTAAFEYNDSVSPAVFLLKDGICGNAAFALGSALAERLKQNGVSRKADLILPVPMYKKDERRRGYNQSEIICREIGRILGIPVYADIIRKDISTSAQKTLNKEERSKNLKGVFSLAESDIIKNKSVLIADDVCTTGSTLAVLSELLMRSGAKEVHCAACCKTMAEDQF